jgi:hypothetical protein
MAPRPNILVILTDQLEAKRLVPTAGVIPGYRLPAAV